MCGVEVSTTRWVPWMITVAVVVPILILAVLCAICFIFCRSRPTHARKLSVLTSTYIAVPSDISHASCGSSNTLPTMHMTSSKCVLQQRHLLGYESEPDTWTLTLSPNPNPIFKARTSWRSKCLFTQKYAMYLGSRKRKTSILCVLCLLMFCVLWHITVYLRIRIKFSSV